MQIQTDRQTDRHIQTDHLQPETVWKDRQTDTVQTDRQTDRHCSDRQTDCTIQVLLQGVGDEPAVVGAGGQEVRDPVCVVVVVTLVPLSVLVRVQLGAVDHRRTVVPRVLVTVAVAMETTTAPPGGQGSMTVERCICCVIIIFLGLFIFDYFFPPSFRSSS